MEGRTRAGQAIRPGGPVVTREGPTARLGRVAILWRGDESARQSIKPESSRFKAVFAALAAVGIEAEPVVYEDDVWDAVREQLATLDGVLVWVNPIHEGRNRAKLDALLPRLAEVVDEGHKALVFSQFTSFLAIVRERLDQEQLVYEYLDGRTRNRAERVERFQTDPACGIFLISLKAGGLGLNLTAAEYVYLLDPWWNPAVEAQAIDRSHRIGQTQHVFAYRLICRDTVEEKILELQQRKRDLADAILNADNRLIQNLTREDLEFLLT